MNETHTVVVDDVAYSIVPPPSGSILRKKANYLPSCLFNKEKLLLDGSNELSDIRLSLVHATAVSDVRGLRYWINQLNTFVTISPFSMDSFARRDVLNILMNLLNTPHMPLSLLGRACSAIKGLLAKKKDRQELIELGVVIDWKQLYEVFMDTLYRKDAWPSYVADSIRSQMRSSFIGAIHKLRSLFSPSSSLEILAELRGSFYPMDDSIFLALGVFALFIPFDGSNIICIDLSETLINECFALWSWETQSAEWDACWLSIIRRLINSTIDTPLQYSINWDSYIDFFYTRLVGYMDLPVGRHKGVSLDQKEFPTSLSPLFSTYSRAQESGKIVITLLCTSSSVRSFENLSLLLISIESYFHPSNGGSWTSFLAVFIRTLVTKFCNFYKKDKFLNTTIPSSDLLIKFGKCMYPILSLARFAKNPVLLSASWECLKKLSFLLPDMFLPDLLSTSFSSLEMVTAAHRTYSTMASLCVTVPVLLNAEIAIVGSSRLRDLLFVTLPGIDPNDLPKTTLTMMFYINLFSRVPISGRGEVEEGFIHEYWVEWVTSFIESSFRVLSSVDAPGKNTAGWSTPLLHSGGEAGLLKIFSITFDLIFSQMDDLVFAEVFPLFFTMVTGDMLQHATKIVAHVYSSVAIMRPEIALSKLLEIVKRVVLCPHPIESELLWYLHLLSCTLNRAGSCILNYVDLLRQIITATINHESKKVSKNSGKVLRAMIYGLCAIYPTDFCSLTSEQWKSDESFRHRWIPETDTEKLNVCYHIPSNDERRGALDIIQHFLDSPLKSLEVLVHTSEKDNGKTKKSVLTSLLIIRNILRSGLVLLEDFTDITQPVTPLEGFVSKFTRPVFSGLVSTTDTSIRDRLADVLHSVFPTIVLKFNDDPSVLGQLLKIYKLLIWHRGMVPVGKECRARMFTDIKTFVRIPHAAKGLTARPVRVLISHTHVLHRQVTAASRLALYSKLVLLINDVFSLVLHHYSAVRKSAQNILSSSHSRYPSLVKGHFYRLLDILKSDTVGKHQLNGIIYSLCNGNVSMMLRRACREWPLFYTLINSILKIETQEDLKIQSRVVFLFQMVGNCLELPVLSPVEPYNTVPMVQSSPFYLINSMIEAAAMNSRKSFYNSEIELRLKMLDELLIILNDESSLTKRTHWRYQLISIMSCTVIFSPIKEDLTKKYISILLRSMTCTVAPMRYFALTALNYILYSARLELKNDSNTIDKSNSSYNVRTSNGRIDVSLFASDDMNEFFDKEGDGWNGVAIQQRISTHRRSGGDYVHPISGMLKDAIMAILMNPVAFNALLDCACVDHIHPGSETSVDINPFTKFAGLTLRNVRGSSYRVSSTSFDDEHALLFKQVFQVCGSECFNVFRDVVEKLCQSKIRDDQATAAEIIAGLGRAIKYFPSSSSLSTIVDFVGNTILSALDCPVSDITPDWITCVAFISFNRDPRRLRHFTTRTTFLDPLGFDNGKHDLMSILQQTKALTAIAPVIVGFAWKAYREVTHLIKYLSDDRALGHPYKQVRSEVARTLAFIVLCGWSPARNSIGSPCFDDGSSFVDINCIIEKFMRLPSLCDVDSKKSEEATIEPMSLSALKLNNDIRQMQETMLTWLAHGLISAEGSTTMSIYAVRLLPNVLACLSSSERELVAIASATVSVISKTKFPKSIMSNLFSILNVASKCLNWIVRKEALSLIQPLSFRHLFFIDSTILNTVTAGVVDALRDPIIEVKEVAMSTLSGLILFSDSSVVFSYRDKFLKQSKHRIEPKGSVTADSSLLERYAGVLGLIAVSMIAHPYDVPSYAPALLEVLSKHIRDPDPIKTTVRKAFMDWNRTHKDSWDEHVTLFTEDQVVAVKELFISPSYYA